MCKLPRPKVSFKTKKKHHVGNQYTKPRPTLEDNSEDTSTPRPTSSTTNQQKNVPNTGSSRPSKKLSFDKFDLFDSSGTGNSVFAITLLSDAIRQFVKCKSCNRADCIELNVCRDDHENNGLVLVSELKCTYCLESLKFKNSKLSADGKLYDLNLKFVYAMRTIGKGPTAGNELCVLLDLPKSPQKYDRYTVALQTAVKSCAEESMLKATQEAVAENNGFTDLAVAIDGSCQRRGFKSLNGLVSVTSFDTGKIMDVSILSSFVKPV